MKLNKILACSLSAAMVVSLAACGGNSDSKGTDTTAASTEGTEKQSQSSNEGQLFEATDASKIPAQATQRGKDTLICGSADFSGVFNPFYWESNEDYRVVTMMTATLSSNDDAGKIIDGTATLSVSDDGLVYTYKLKDDKYSDGSPVKAEDYANYFKIIADKSYDGYLDISTDKIKGYEDYKAGKTKEFEGIKAVDDKTLEISLDETNSMAKYDLGAAYPVSTALYGDTFPQGDVSKFKALDMTKYVSNGAYTLTEYKEKTSATLTSNPNFINGAPKIKTIIFKVVATNAELQAVETGDVDVEEDVVCDADHIEEGQASEFINMWQQPTLGYGYVGINDSLEQFKDPKVRQALLFALDRKSVNESVYGEYAQTLNIPQARFSWVYDDEGLETYDYNLEKAASLLEEAGWKKDGDKLMKDGKQMAIMFTAMSDNPVTTAMIPVMTDAYKQLGIDFQAEYVDWPTLQTKSQTGDFQMFFMAWGLTASPDCQITYASADKGGGQNHLGYSNSELDQLFVDAKAAKNDDEVKAIYKKIYKIINEDLPCFIIYQRSDLICYNTRVKNLVSTPYCKWYNQDKIANVELAE